MVDVALCLNGAIHKRGKRAVSQIGTPNSLLPPVPRLVPVLQFDSMGLSFAVLTSASESDRSDRNDQKFRSSPHVLREQVVSDLSWNP